MTHSRRPDMSAFGLHMLALLCMLSDHLWATVVPGNAWLTVLGRLAFPLYAFCAVEGYFRTKDRKKYFRRLLLLALVSEIPFNLMYADLPLYPFHQNTVWTLLGSLLCIHRVERIRHKNVWWKTALAAGLIFPLGCLLSQLLMLDYGAGGALTLFVFYCFRRCPVPWRQLGELLGLFYINCLLIKGLVVPLELGPLSFDLPRQAAALLTLLPLWLYRGRQGLHNRPLQCAFYAFYPLHMLLLALF